MNHRTQGRRLAIALAAVFAIGTAAGVVYGYWTGSGAGAGTADASSLADLTVNQVSELAPMYPGDKPQALQGHFDNPNDGPILVTTVTVSIAGVTQAKGSVGSCDETDFTLSDATTKVYEQVPAGHGVGKWSGPTIGFNNKPEANQDGCQGATVTLAYSIP